jgi:hypothetical protein
MQNTTSEGLLYWNISPLIRNAAFHGLCEVSVGIPLCPPELLRSQMEPIFDLTLLHMYYQNQCLPHTNQRVSNPLAKRARSYPSHWPLPLTARRKYGSRTRTDGQILAYVGLNENVDNFPTPTMYAAYFIFEFNH